MRLSDDTLATVPASVRRPSYRRDRQAIGIVHLGIGAFHRAHQAVYTDSAMEAGERDWAIAGVSLRSATVAGQMAPQDGLFSLAIKSPAAVSYRVIGSVQEVLVARERPAAVHALLAAAGTRIVTLTVTEKGYCRSADDRLDASLAASDTIYGHLAAGLALRRDAGLPGVSVLSCDNLPGNGPMLRRLLGEFLERHDPSLTEWVMTRCAFPSSMVDRIVPATSEDDLRRARAALGVRDEAHVSAEPFTQWVVEDRFAGPRPRWEDHGVELVSDVRPYEDAKLRMLNGAHSALAYAGLMHGYRFVHEAIADVRLRAMVERLMLDEAAPTVARGPNQDLERYADDLLRRFANGALGHRLEQIAMDGSQKIPQRWLETLIWNRRVDRSCPAVLQALGAWLLHMRGDLRPVSDPLAGRIADAWREAGEAGILDSLFGDGGLVSSRWAPTPQDRIEVRRAMEAYRS